MSKPGESVEDAGANNMRHEIDIFYVTRNIRDGDIIFEHAKRKNLTEIPKIWYTADETKMRLMDFLASVEFDAEKDLKLMKIYYEELTKRVRPEDYSWEVFQREVEIRTLQLSMSGFNFFKFSPETFSLLKQMFEKKGLDLGDYLNKMRTKFLRFAKIMEKWEQQNILERIEEF